MSVLHWQDEHVDAVAERLVREFAPLGEENVCETVRAARRDLEGQIVPEALTEMLHRLAHYRLARMTRETS